jgi:hypothetical protein
MVWSARTIAEKLLRRPTNEQQAYDTRYKREREREAFLRELSRRHGERMGLSATVARKHIDAVSCTARRAVRDELGLD